MWVIEIDFPGELSGFVYNFSKENRLVSMKFIAKKIKEKSFLLKNFNYLTKLTYGTSEKPKISKKSLFRLRFVIKAWNLQRNLQSVFKRKEIIREIFRKID